MRKVVRDATVYLGLGRRLVESDRFLFLVDKDFGSCILKILVDDAFLTKLRSLDKVRFGLETVTPIVHDGSSQPN